MVNAICFMSKCIKGTSALTKSMLCVCVDANGLVKHMIYHSTKKSTLVTNNVIGCMYNVVNLSLHHHHMPNTKNALPNNVQFKETVHSKESIHVKGNTQRFPWAFCLLPIFFFTFIQNMRDKTFFPLLKS